MSTCSEQPSHEVNFTGYSIHQRSTAGVSPCVDLSARFKQQVNVIPSRKWKLQLGWLVMEAPLRPISLISAAVA